ncbi:DltD domain-containing protein [Lophiotrema nucula]|uniref:DltD domain-containing protein n=1 Tax=Lophiotrema nucula TaxID=690887 RepID=A0A6A5ZLP3_9PLEO|nr:DltD domain-containing protein [Lophiotrema nucula]
MAPSRPHRTVSCQTIDGVTLEAWFWEVTGPAPAIVMTHGLNCVKEMSLEETAEGFQAAGYNVLLYDSRGIGGSGGVPRNQPDPWQYAQDVSDVVTYVSSLPSVDASRILLWGISFGASVTGCAAAIDRRVAAVLMVCPIFKFIRPDKRKTLFAQLMKDRRSQLRGNDPFLLRPFDSKGENPAGYAGSGGPGGKEAYTLMEMALERGHPTFRNRITLQTFHKLAIFRPADLLEEMMDDMPLMMVVPELDAMSFPADQLATFDKLRCPKRLYMVRDRGHVDVLVGTSFKNTMNAMLEFYEEALEGTIEKDD